jgi:hypothetical protein
MIKKNVFFKTAYSSWMLFLLAIFSGSLSMTGQISVAPNPVVAGTFGNYFSYSNTQNSQNFGNYFGRSTNDVSYRFTLSMQMDLVITNCGSSLSDTYLYLLDANGNTIADNDDYRGTEGCSNVYHSVIKKTLPVGTYYVITEGYGANGYITTNISGTLYVDNITGNTIGNPIVMGDYGFSFTYSNSQNTSDFTNTYGQSSNDVFYKFTLTIPMTVTVSHCGSSLLDTYLHLLDADGNRIAYNDDDNNGSGNCSNKYHSFLKRELEAGTYYIVSEGYSANGIISTSISGKYVSSACTYSYDASGNRILRQPVNPTLSHAAGLRSAGTGTEMIDPGRDGSKDEAKNVEGSIGAIPENPLQPAVTVYPNPTDRFFTVNIPSWHKDVTGEIRIYDSVGKILYIRNITGEMESFDLSGYDAGIYMAEISVDGKKLIYKIVKNK